MKQLFTLALVLMSTICFSQSTQNIYGTVFDKDTRQFIIGASISIEGTSPLIGTVTDENGSFILENVPIGRHALRCQYIGYSVFLSEGIIVNSVKENFIEIGLVEEAILIDGVVVKGLRYGNEPINEASIVSTRSFSVEETERIPAGANDPGRMALAYPGVQQGRDDGENDVIIRGNSSFGMLWRLEGIDIPNPNHFARPGTSGGGITVFSAQLLDRSDFSTGAMPAEYGNAISGAFDVHLRPGNKEARNHRIKIGVLGLDFATEGPIKKANASYLINYRYSTLSILNQFGFNLVGERVDNDFQDLSFNISIDGKDPSTQFNVFGMGGLSEEHYRPVADPVERSLETSNHWEDRIQGSNMGLVGFNFTKLIDETAYIKWVGAVMGSEIFREFDTLSLMDERFRYNTEGYADKRISTALSYNKKLKSGIKLKTGIIAHQIFYNFFKESAPRRRTSDITNPDNFRSISIDGTGNTQTVQAFVQTHKQINNYLSINAGVHYLLLGLNGKSSIEPRLSMKYQMNEQHSLSLAYAELSKTLPFGAYFYSYQDSLTNQMVRPNEDLPFVKASHLIASYNYFTKSQLRFSLEAYYQGLRNVLVAVEDRDDPYWMLNVQQDVPEFLVEAEGTGLNYGVDVAIEKFFTNQLYFLLTASRFESKFTLPDGRTFNTRFGTKWASTYTLGREFNFKKGSVLQLGARVLYNGGFRYTPLDVSASLEQGRYVGDYTRAWEEQVNPYFRIDSRISYRYNKPKFAGVISLDIQNVMNKKNNNRAGYDAVNNVLTFRNHPSGLIPVLSFRFDF